MQETFGIIMLALVNGQPKILDLKQMLEYYIEHRHTVVYRRSQFELKQAQDRMHILEGLQIAVDNIDEVIEIIRNARSVEVANAELRAAFNFSEIQAKAILEMRLSRLTGLERQKLIDEIRELKKRIGELVELVESRDKRMALVKKELREVRDKYGDDRRTLVVDDTGEVAIEDLIAQEDMVVTISHGGYIKRFPVSGFRKQGRGGRGSQGASTREEDWIETLFVASTHDYIMFFTNKGRCYWLKVYQIPQLGRGTRGKALVNLIERSADEKVRAFLTVREFSENRYVFLATRNGTVKKTALSEYSNPRSTGIIALNIEPGDELIEAALTDGTNEILIATSEGKAVRFDECEVRPMGRSATGVRGVMLKAEQKAVGMIVVAQGRFDPHGDGTGLRQALFDRRFPPHEARHLGRSGPQDHAQDRPARHGEGDRQRGRSDHRDQRRRGDPPERGEAARNGPRHAGRAPHQTRRRRPRQRHRQDRE